MMARTRIAGSIVAVLALGCAGLFWSGSGVLVAERLEQPETPALAVLLKGQWSDGSRLDLDRLRMKCTYFTGTSLVRQVHAIDSDRGNVLSSCPTLMNGKLTEIPVLQENQLPDDYE